MKDSFSYVTTQSGPVVPAKKKSIDMMTNIIANMQNKYKKGQPGVKFGELAGKFNKDVKPHGYTTMHDILKKALTEATAYSAGKPLFRLDLGNVVADAAHAKFRMHRHKHDVMVEMLYPNSNGNITMCFNVDDNAMKMFELSLDSEQYIDNFGKTLLSCCDDCIAEAAEMTEESDIFSTDNGYEPLVDADMRGLQSIVNTILEGTLDMNSPETFADPTANTETPSNDVSNALDAGATLSDPNAPIAPDAPASEDEESQVNFREEFKKMLTIDNTLKKLDNILASKMANKVHASSTGVELTDEQFRDGMQGIADSMSADEKIDKFCGYYGIDNPMVSEKTMEMFKHGFEHNKCENALEFESWVNRIPKVSKEIFNQDNTSGDNINDVSIEQASDAMPQDNSMDSLFTTDQQVIDYGQQVETPVDDLANIDEYSQGADNELNVTSDSQAPVPDDSLFTEPMGETPVEEPTE